MNIFTFSSTTWVRSLAVLALCSMIASAFPAPFLVAHAEDNDGKKVNICKANQSGPGFVAGVKSVNENAINEGLANSGENFDIVENGQNWDYEYPNGQTGEEIFNAGCVMEMLDDEPAAPIGTLRVCKIMVDSEGDIITGSGLATDFSVALTGPNGYAETVEFSTALTLNTDLVNDNGGDNDAECVELAVAPGEYLYEAEQISGDGDWAAPLYHDFFSTTPNSVGQFAELTVDGSPDDNDDTDGVMNVAKNKQRTLAIVNTLLPVEPEVTECTFTMVSDVNDFVEDTNDAAKALTDTHSNWIASIGSSLAVWIWGDDPVQAPTTLDETQTFKKSFNWTGDSITSATLTVASDNSHAITLGAFSGGNPGEFNYNATTDYDVEAAIVSGLNTLEIAVKNFALANSNPANNPAGLIYELVIEGTTTDSQSCGEVVPHEPEELEEFCSYDGRVIYTTPNEEALKNNGNPVDSNRRNVSGVENGPATYQNTGGKDGNSWSTTDFFSLGIGGELVYEFTSQVAIGDGTAAADIAIYEITGGTSGQSDEEVEVLVSTDNVTYTSVGTFTGDAYVDIDTAGLPFVKYVKLVDQSAGVQGANGDGYDVDAIVILNDRCGDEPVVETGSLEITNPATDGMVLSGTHTFMADYQDADDNEDEVFWAIRAGSCNGVDMVGNAPASPEPNNPSTFNPVTGAFETTVDMSGWDNGNYCLVVNPKEDPGAPNLRETRTFVLDNQIIQPLTFRIEGVKTEIRDGQSATGTGWTIEAYRPFSEAAPLSTTTDSNGYYYFDVEPGYWVVSEVMQTDWEQVEVRQNGTTVESEGPMAECEFNLGLLFDEGYDFQLSEILITESEYESSNVTCDFDNEYTGEEITEQPPVTPPTRRSSGGTRIVRTEAPAPEVLGATTSAADFCPFLTDYMQMGVENDSWEVMKLQAFLNIFKDMFGGTENPITGQFDVTTDANVKAFQAHFQSEILDPWYNLGIVPHNRPTGFVYKTTLWKINSIVCPDYAEDPDFTGESLDSNVKI